MDRRSWTGARVAQRRAAGHSGAQIIAGVLVLPVPLSFGGCPLGFASGHGASGSPEGLMGAAYGVGAGTTRALHCPRAFPGASARHAPPLVAPRWLGTCASRLGLPPTPAAVWSQDPAALYPPSGGEPLGQVGCQLGRQAVGSPDGQGSQPGSHAQPCPSARFVSWAPCR